ncbi:hypothetical protein H920_15516 [Fukomys damarensis]|uniref:Uncharacterized protein n=1 Tax=Fukomys damarensis TaxID=885580 RepID=A0A091DJX9_FUKDA|nr:hypothetical protein H920_15516 [Fukomys damarensis]
MDFWETGKGDVLKERSPTCALGGNSVSRTKNVEGTQGFTAKLESLSLDPKENHVHSAERMDHLVEIVDFKPDADSE